jgi:hypothetical protein
MPSSGEQSVMGGVRLRETCSLDSNTVYGCSMYSSFVNTGDFERLFPHHGVAFLDSGISDACLGMTVGNNSPSIK